MKKNITKVEPVSYRLTPKTLLTLATLQKQVNTLSDIKYSKTKVLEMSIVLAAKSKINLLLDSYYASLIINKK